MAEGESEDDKPYEASPKKLEDARKKGEVPHSQDLTTTAAYGGFLIAGIAVGPQALLDTGAVLAGFLSEAPRLAASPRLGQAMQTRLTADLVPHILPFFLFPMAAALLSVIAQQAFVIAGEKLQPRLSRISPLSIAKQKFGANGLFEFAKSTAKLTIFGTILGVFLWRRLPDILASLSQPPAGVTVTLFAILMDFLIIVALIAAAIGFVDLVWQRAEHARKHRMSHKELRDESKESDGDPHMKQNRRQKAIEIATNRMLADVPGADVVIVNPTHYAVALRWDRGSGRAPVCVAKGVDEIAARIRDVAIESGVPIHRDPPTARALYAGVEIGAEIRRSDFEPVAAAIRFAETVRARARGRT